MKKPGLILLGLLVLGVLPIIASGSNDPIVVVLSSNLGPYKEALEGFESALGHSVPTFILSEGAPIIPSSARIIVAIGGKAALYSYSQNHLLIYCLAPGTKLESDHYAGRLLEIQTSPAMVLSISKFKELQPSLKRLAIIWSGDAIQDYIDQKKNVNDRLGVTIISDRIKDPEDLPDHLRALKGKIDAIWLPADAAMVTPKNFATIKNFSLANGIPFYVPSEGLVEQGATASVSTSFKEIGALAAQMTHQAVDGSLNIDQVFPEHIHLTINLSAATTCNLKIPPELLKQADKVFP